MSTDQQELSIGTQLAAIQAYAQANAISVVKTYEDAAKSGLGISKRDGMKSLLRDVMDDPRPFDIVLVYDVSRWGRFQDIDAAAYYEYTCRLHGARVVYVQEAFGSDHEPMTALLKTLKRAMAAEYSRELGVKSRAGQDRAIQLGFQMGHLPCMGLTRVAIDKDGVQRPLSRGQRKSMQSERIAWVPGPIPEVDLVRRVFDIYTGEGGTIKGTARQLRFEGRTTPDGRPFTASMVDTMLRCEAYAGNFVWGRERYVAGTRSKRRPETRASNVIERVVPQDLWERAQGRLWERRRLRRDKEQLLQVLRERLAENPTLNALDLEGLGLHSKKAYTNAFGSVSRALELAGRDAKLVRAQHEQSKVTGRQIGDRLECDIKSLLLDAGIACRIHPRSRVLIVGEDLRVRLQPIWPRTLRGASCWHVFKRRRPMTHAVLLAQMDAGPVVRAFVLLTPEAYRGAPAWFSQEVPDALSPLKSADLLLSALRSFLERPSGTVLQGERCIT
ncbi:recombinase family protein [Hydrogenophaga crocea]|uniref:Recombinase family protein n=2 Tax=Comamonadaceae TaxID=80864 RepID=A0A6G8IIY9_9BURK|nr:recombinase family protein [Hydrogenophaga crocea]